MASYRNIVILLAHGLRSDALGDCGVWPLRTTNLEKLATHGLRLTAGSACPADPGGMLCMMSGLHARQHGHVDPLPGPVTCGGWPALLADKGYHVVGVGCVSAIEPWLSEAVVVKDVDCPDPAGCAYFAAMRRKNLHGALTGQRRQRLRYGPFEPDRLVLEPDDDIDGYIARKARHRLTKMPDDKPWALIVAFSGPGNDLPPPAMYEFSADATDLEAGFIPPDFTELDCLAELDYPRIMLQRLEPRKIARIRSDYLGRVSLIDHGVGRITSALNKRADRDRTWLVLSSDRGQLLGEHGLVGHRSFLAGAVEVPLIVCPPTPAPAAEDDGLLTTVDVAATIADLAGCDLPRQAVGRSVLAMLRGQPLHRDAGSHCISEFGRRLMLELDRYKVIYQTESGAAIGLYDKVNDPDERHNLVDVPAGANVLDSLRWQLSDALLPLRAVPNGAT